ncbi:hypothetical protein V8D89_000744 [Ganoderma adspersum]
MTVDEQMSFGCRLPAVVQPACKRSLAARIVITLFTLVNRHLVEAWSQGISDVYENQLSLVHLTGAIHDTTFMDGRSSETWLRGGTTCTTSDRAVSTHDPHFWAPEVGPHILLLHEAIRAPLNRSLFIHKLPNELLIHIFQYLPHTPWRTQDEYGRPESLDLGWPGLMLVCSHWRDLLVSTPVFWRQVNFRRQPNWTELCLSRSAPGSIDVFVGRNFDASRLDDIRPHAHRCKTFYYGNQFVDFPLVEALAPLFDNGMPLLPVEELHLMVRESGTPSPQLDTEMTSQRVIAPQDVSLYAQLRKLELEGCSPPLSLDGFLDALAATMQLEQLHLSGSTLRRLSGEWRHPGGGHVPYRPPISLPHLRDFLLEDDRIDRISCFLAHLQPQPSAVLCIHGRVSGETANTIDAMLPPNRTTTLPALGLATDGHLTLRGSEYNISCGYIRPHRDGPKNFPRAIFRLDLGSLSAGRVGLDDLVLVFLGGAASPLRRLSVNGDHGRESAAAWAGVFRAFPHLEELILFRDCRAARDVTDVFRGLHAASSTSVGCADCARVACPSLRDIYVQGTSTVETYEAIRECFQYRSARGVALESLNIVSLVGWADVPTPLRRGFVRDISAAVKAVLTAHDMSEWGREHRNSKNDSEGSEGSEDGHGRIALVM